MAKLSMLWVEPEPSMLWNEQHLSYLGLLYFDYSQQQHKHYCRELLDYRLLYEHFVAYFVKCEERNTTNSSKTYYYNKRYKITICHHAKVLTIYYSEYCYNGSASCYYKHQYKLDKFCFHNVLFYANEHYNKYNVHWLVRCQMLKAFKMFASCFGFIAKTICTNGNTCNTFLELEQDTISVWYLSSS